MGDRYVAQRSKARDRSAQGTTARARDGYAQGGWHRVDEGAQGAERARGAEAAIRSGRANRAHPRARRTRPVTSTTIVVGARHERRAEAGRPQAGRGAVEPGE